MVQRDGVARQCNCASNKGRISIKQIDAGKKQPGRKPQHPPEVWRERAEIDASEYRVYIAGYAADVMPERFCYALDA
jgi:hypothetical protein